MVSRRFNRSLRLASWLVAATFCVACESLPPLPTQPSPSGPPTSVQYLKGATVKPGDKTIPYGGSVQLTAQPDTGPSPAPAGTTFSTSWASSDPNVVTVGATTGLAVGMRVGSALVTAKVTQDGSNYTAQASALITVEFSDPPPPLVVFGGVFDVTATQRAPVNTCFIPGYAGTVQINDAPGPGILRSIEIQYVGSSGLNTRSYFMTEFSPTDGTFAGISVLSRPASKIKGKVTANADGTTTITAEETLDPCPTVPTGPIFDIFGKRRS
jgi:hypothetical protein